MVNTNRLDGETYDEYLHRVCNEFYNSGRTICEIAYNMDLSFTQVFNYCCKREYFTGDILDEIKYLRDILGLSYAEISRKLGISRTTARRKYNNGNKFDNHINGNLLTSVEVERFRKLFLDGWSIPKIARETNTTIGCVRYRLAKMGLYATGHRKITPREVEQFRKLRSKGYTIKKISAITGRSVNAISNHLK